MPDAVSVARRLHLTGLVQGVGFRPFVHRLALKHELAGWVRNASGAVEIHVEGPADALDRFADALRHEAPVLARIESLVLEESPITGYTDFEVRASAISLDDRLPVAPDVAMCDACARELADPADRRFRYPFITCTDCGPRFTVIASMPYDRERTSMRAFRQCARCSEEYATPGDRRYHSETNSCPACGPTLWFTTSAATGIPDVGEHALASAAALLRRGGILAVRGLGGFHLATDATNADAVARLRLLKHREAKPLAVMMRTLDEARRLARVTAAEAVELTSRARPIVLLSRREGSGAGSEASIAANVAPGLGLLGVMLAYTPLHHLLLEAAGAPLVMTSGNVSEEPIAIGNDEAMARLGAIADGFLLHDREIVARYDDSVVRVVDGAPVFVRRARGYAPEPIDLPVATPRPLLAVGPHLKNTFTLLLGHRAYVSQHIGDLENIETLDHFRRAAERFELLFHIRPECVVHDLHPGYLSTRLAIESGLELLPAVQHHHAHVAAVLAEHGRNETVIGVAYDGTGYGDDGTVWGSEILHAGLQTYRRLGHLRAAPLPGGDVAARAPWRVALGYATLAEDPSALGGAWEGVPRQEHEVVRRQLER
ncbi:MAG: carbamoyltransferase HypF, partial [Gemmatimonadetes bacterium]|nr:carbamoyltransferase HypF [Gemmatimonadota bacterium]